MGKITETAEKHWSYIESLLKAHESTSAIALIKFHYITAFIHGHKHGMDDALNMVTKPTFG